MGPVKGHRQSGDGATEEQGRREQSIGIPEDLVVFHSTGGWSERDNLFSVKHNVLLLQLGVSSQTYNKH